MDKDSKDVWQEKAEELMEDNLGEEERKFDNIGEREKLFDIEEQQQKSEKKKRRKPKKKVKTIQKLDLAITAKKYLLRLGKSSQKQDGLDQFLSFIYNEKNSQISKKGLLYVAEKYVNMIAVRQKLINFRNSIDKKFPRAGIKALLSLMQKRQHRFKQKDQIILVILLEDLLKIWSQQNLSPESSSLKLQNLLLLYKKSEDSEDKKIPVISALIESLMILIDIREQHNSEQKTSNLSIIPKLTFTLIYSMIYLGGLACGYTFSVDDVVVGAGEMALEVQMEQKIEMIKINERINNRKIRKQVSKLYHFLGWSMQANVYTIKEWVNKYTFEFQLQEHSQKINTIAQVLFQGLATSQINEPFSKKYYRNPFLEQDLISKCIILVFLKLEIGFDRLPYLLTLPENILKELPPSPQKKIIEKFIRLREKQVDLIDLAKKLSKKEHTRSSCINEAYPISSYACLENLGCHQLLHVIEKRWMNLSRKQLIHLPEPSTLGVYTKKHTPSIQVIQEQLDSQQKNEQKRYLKGAVKQQIVQLQAYLQDDKLDIQKIETSQLEPYIQNMDWPADNYQFLFRYTHYFRFINKDLFAYFTQKIISKQSTQPQFFHWLQKIQKVLIKFEN